MIYNDLTYRPPFEAGSLLLPVTRGCSHNKCSFCNMYQDIPFQIYSMNDIERIIEEVQQTKPSITRIFLEHGDPFVLATERLLQIGQKLNEAFPKLETISCYASIKNIMNKSVCDLKKLKKVKFDQLNIGIESALDDVLISLNKGCRQKDVYHSLEKLNEAKMDFGINIILGAAGHNRHKESAAANAALLNSFRPYLIFTTTLHYDHESKLYQDIQAGRFVEATVRELILEEYSMIEQLSLEKSYLYGLHTSNVIPLCGSLPEEKKWMLSHIDTQMSKIPKYFLDHTPIRFSAEGAIQL